VFNEPTDPSGILNAIGYYCRSWISPSFTPWIEETVALPAAEVPLGCFSLVFYSDNVEAMQSIVEILAEDTAWQEASVRTYAAEAHPTCTWSEVIHQNMAICYFSEAFPGVMRALGQERTLIRFEGISDMLTIIDTHAEALRGRNSEHMSKNWCSGSTTMRDDPRPPLHYWLDILYEYVRNSEETTGTT
jgi:hypothetical protein